MTKSEYQKNIEEKHKRQEKIEWYISCGLFLLTLTTTLVLIITG
jgi:hypothetical protein